MKLEEVLKAEIKARKNHDKVLGDALAAATAGASVDLSAVAQKCEAAVAAVDKKCEVLREGQQNMHAKQEKMAADHAALAKVGFQQVDCIKPSRSN